MLIQDSKLNVEWKLGKKDNHRNILFHNDRKKILTQDTIKSK